ncbi:MAG: M23 family metallopeptidase [Chromatiales bacterium]|nr:M23 family metallopeptidase [Chromatiales bacterium]
MTDSPTARRPFLFAMTLLVLLPFGSVPVAAESGLRLDGPRLQGGLLRGRVPPGSTVEYEGGAVRVSQDGWFLVGFGRDAPPEAELAVVYPDGRSERQVLKVERREYNVQRIDGLPPSKVTPSEDDLARIRKEVRIVKQARKIDHSRTDFLSGFQWPVKGIISGVYGSQRVLNGEPRRPHFGIDIAAPRGTKVVAPTDGVVTLVHPDMYFSGGTMIVDHGHGLSSAFLHLSRILVEKGERVTQGQVIAEVGSTGRSTGPHLDWRINLFDRRLDPSLLVGPMPE